MAKEHVNGFSEELFDTMQSSGTSQREIERTTGVNHSSISRILSNGTIPRLDTAIRIVDALNITPERRLELLMSAVPRSERKERSPDEQAEVLFDVLDPEWRLRPVGDQAPIVEPIPHEKGLGK